MKEEMHILFACNSAYVMPLSVCLTSLLEHNKDNSLHIYVLYEKLSEHEKNILKELVVNNKQNINLIQVPSNYFAEAPLLRWSKEAYFRLLVGQLLPQTIDRVLYMDCDTVIQKPLNDLYNIDLEQNYIAALQEKNGAPARKRLGLQQNGFYYQSGVILFDLKRCRPLLAYTDVEKMIQALGSRLTVVDQDIFNILFDGKIKPLDKIYNNSEVTNFEDAAGLGRLFQKISTANIEKNYILHYATGKPWNNLYPGSCEVIWYKYLKRSPFADLYYKKYNTVPYKILRNRFVKFVFYTYIHITPVINSVFNHILPQKSYIALKQYYRRNIK